MKHYTITRLGHKGDGIADGPIFAPQTLPGEIVTGVVHGQRLRNIKIETPSSDRVAAPCRHFKSCGGCQLQHASDAFLAVWKVDVVRAALAAHEIEAEFLPIIVSPPQSRRRATLTARRTKKGAMAGFHAKESDAIVEIPDCRLLHPDLLMALPVAESLAMIGASRKHSVSVTARQSENGLDILVAGGKSLDGPLRIELAGLAEKYQLARICWEDEVIATRHPPEQRFGLAKVVPPPGAFLQATREGEAALLADVQQHISGAKRLVDLFAGCGTFYIASGQTQCGSCGRGQSRHDRGSGCRVA